MTRWTGHSVLVVPVPELEPFVRGRWEHYEPTWVARDPAFTHAHLTVLSPFLPAPTPVDLARVAEIAAATDPVDFVLEDVREFPDGCIHLAPSPAAPFAALTHALWEAFPDCPPYGGVYGVEPHVTLDQRSPAVTVDSTRAALAAVLPVQARADRLELHWYAPGDCHVRDVWPLGVRRVTPEMVGSRPANQPIRE